MAYRVEFTRSAVKQLAGLPKSAQLRIRTAIELLKTDPRPPKPRKLAGSLRGLYRIRTGDYRIVYLIEDDKLVVCVVRIGDRKDIYRGR